MARIACLMMQKDEALLLRPWLLYHGYLFGFENLYVYDNGSESATVLDTLKEFAGIGVHVDLTFTRQKDFERKGGIIGDKVSEFKNLDLYDIAIPLDCDEFLALIDFNQGITCSMSSIESELERIYEGGVVSRVAHCLDNRPGHFDLFRFAGHVKSILIVREFIALDHGFHAAEIPPGKEYGPTSLIHIHMHFKPFEDILRGARDKLRPFVDIDDQNALRDFRGRGVHLTRLFSISDSDYYLNLHGYKLPALRFRGLARLLGIFADVGELRGRWERGRPDGDIEKLLVIDLDRTSFIPSSYLAANPDLSGEESDLLQHFMRHGYCEGRTLEPTKDGLAEAADRLAYFRERRHDGSLGYEGIALTLSRLGRAAEAEQLLADALKQYGHKEGLMSEYAFLAEYEEKFDEAASRWSLFRDRFPDKVDGFYHGAMASLESGKLTEAEEIAVAGLARFPGNLELSIQYANILTERGEWARARALWDTISRLDPDNQQLQETADAAIVDLVSKTKQSPKRATTPGDRAVTKG